MNKFEVGETGIYLKRDNEGLVYGPDNKPIYCKIHKKTQVRTYPYDMMDVVYCWKCYKTDPENIPYLGRTT